MYHKNWWNNNRRFRFSQVNLQSNSSSYSETTESLWFYPKDGATNFNVDIANDNNFKSFMYKAKLLENNEADGDNGISKNVEIAVSLKYLSNFWRLLEMPWINCKFELKIKWTNYCIISAAGADNVNNKDNNIIFTIKDIKLYVAVLTLSAENKQKLLNFLSKGFERSVYWNEYKTKSENRNTANEYKYFLKSNSVGVNRLFALVYLNVKRFNARKYYLQK